MKIWNRYAGWVVLMLFAATDCRAAPPLEIRQSFDIAVPAAPAPVRIGEATQLAYELHLTNFSRSPLELTGVQVLDDRDGRIVSEVRGAELPSLVGKAGAAEETGKPTIVPSGGRAIVYLAVALSDAARPRALRHRIAYTGTGPVHGTVEGGATAIDSRPLPILGPPLRGGPWVGVYDPDMERGHRRVVYAVGGRARIPGRFAIDWMRAPGSRDDGLGADVLAVADAVVVAARDGVPEPARGAERPAGALADATGNYVALDLGGGRYAFYEHLMPGLGVRTGDRVREGQVIAKLGSTGQASRPHLHFHVADADFPLAEGLPYLLKEFATLGAYDSIEAFDQGGPWRRSAVPAQPNAPQFPEPNRVVEFPDLGSELDKNIVRDGVRKAGASERGRPATKG